MLRKELKLQGATPQAIMTEIKRLGLHQITMMTGEIDIRTQSQNNRYPNPVTLTLILSVILSITTLTRNYDDRCGRAG